MAKEKEADMTGDNQIFDKEFEAAFWRIETLRHDNPALWGKMNVAQMLAHCSEVQEVFNGKELKNTPWFLKLMGGYIRKMVFNDKPFPHSTRTHSQYIVDDERDFESEKLRLVAALNSLKNGAPHPDNARHPLFGEMSQQEKTVASFKHLDHHLQQFGV
ncbi:MAG: hypothetical protein ACI9UK_001735 [Candidatus Krumholzibacteriia bacterium]|jgi:hypothetical protein